MTGSALALAALLAAAPATAAGVSDGRYLMGTVLEATVEAASEDAARAALEEVYAETARLEALLTVFDPASEVSRLNARAGEPAGPVSPEVGRILADARRLSGVTRGAFDVTVGPLVRLWTEAGRSDTLPTPEALAAARGRVGASGIVVDGGRAGLARAGMSLDLGGLAKGWALDRAGEILRRRGVTRALLSFGQSSLLALGHPPAGEGWRVLVRDPRGDYAGVVSLRDLSLSVSGSFGASSVIQGRRFGHVLDPRSGWPLTRAAQAVVLAPNGALAEALGKALLVLKPEESLALLASLEGVEGLLIGEGGDLARSGGFDAATSWQPLARKATEPR